MTNVGISVCLCVSSIQGPATSKWKDSVPDCSPLSSCLMESSRVLARSTCPGDEGLSACDWPVSERAGGNWSRGGTRPGPAVQTEREREGRTRAGQPSSAQHAASTLAVVADQWVSSFLTSQHLKAHLYSHISAKEQVLSLLPLCKLLFLFTNAKYNLTKN